MFQVSPVWSFLSDNSLTLTVRDSIIVHLVSLRQFNEYFPATAEVNSRSEKPIQHRSMLKEQEGLIELSCDETMKFAFRNQTFLTFLTLTQGHALPLLTTYSCKKSFSSYARIQK